MLRIAPMPLAENSQLLLRNTRMSESSLRDQLESIFRDTGCNFFYVEPLLIAKFSFFYHCLTNPPLE
jgi:hypothetical protein